MKNNCPQGDGYEVDGVTSYRLQNFDKHIGKLERQVTSLSDKVVKLTEHQKWLEMNDVRLEKIEKDIERVINDLDKAMTESGRNIKDITNELNVKFNKIVIALLSVGGTVVAGLLTTLFQIFL